MQIRYGKLGKLLEEKNIDALLVSDGYNMRYFSGFTGATGYLLVTKKSKYLFTDSRYTIAAKAQAPDYTVIEVDANRDYCKEINTVIDAENLTTLGFEAKRVAYSEYASLNEKLKIKELVALGGELAKQAERFV